MNTVAYGIVGSLFILNSFIHNYVLFKWFRSVFGFRIKTRATGILFCIGNSIFIMVAVLYGWNNSLWFYIISPFILFVEMTLLVAEKPQRLFLCALIPFLHIATLRTLSVAIMALITHTSFYLTAQTLFSNMLSMLITLIVTNCIAFFTQKISSPAAFKTLTQHKEQFQFLMLWFSVCSFYIIINARSFSHNEAYSLLNEMQAVTSIALLIATYVVLVFSFKIITLCNYKEKNSELEKHIHTEKQFKKVFFEKTAFSYEINFSKNRIISAIEQFRKVTYTQAYEKVANELIQKHVYPDDQACVAEKTTGAYILSQFQHGNNELTYEYRMKTTTNEYRWFSQTLHIIQDNSGDIIGFAHIRDIHKKKEAELALQFNAEHDSLTSLYNKGATQKYIIDALQAEQQTASCGAFYIIDIDNFKKVNDTLGHVFGDIVLSELSDKLRQLFNEHDTVGRIGGDEFIIYTPHVDTMQKVQETAHSICTVLSASYTHKSKKSISISGSVGIALFPKDGATFEELYTHADIALYESKNRGKNTFTFFENKSFQAYKPQLTQIDTHGVNVQKGFKSNKTEYIFQLLYTATDPLLAINSVLELLTEHYHFSRAYLFEVHDDMEHISALIEVCAPNGVPIKEHFQNMPISHFREHIETFKKKGMYHIEKDTLVPERTRKLLTKYGVHSCIRLGIFDKDMLIGFIGFDNQSGEQKITDEQLDEMRTMSNILSTFIVKYHATQRELHNYAALSAVMYNLDSYTYVVDGETHKILFLSQKMYELATNAKVGDICYEAFLGIEKPCKICALKINAEVYEKQQSELYSDFFKKYFKTTISQIDWINGKKVYLVENVDISEYKQ